MARVINLNETKVRCGCGADIAYVQRDIVQGSDMDDGQQYKYVVCPACKGTIDLLKREQENQRLADNDL